MRSIEFALGLFDREGVVGIAADDLDGPHGELLRAWQETGFISRESAMHPTPSCPHCEEGVPYRLGDRILCNVCGSSVDPRRFLLWSLHRETFLAKIGKQLHLQGGIRMIDASVWQLGTGQDAGDAVECFYYTKGVRSEQAQRKLRAYRRVVILHGPSVLSDTPQHGRWVPLLELFRPDGSLVDTDLSALLRPRGAVRFDAHSGTLWVGDVWLGEAALGSREFYLLECLAENLDNFLPYSDLKREVLRRSGSSDQTDEASFCHGLKRRLKKRGIAEIDRLLVTTNKSDGYRLRGFVTDV